MCLEHSFEDVKFKKIDVMKNVIITICTSLLLIFGTLVSSLASEKVNSLADNPVHVWASQDVVGLAKVWTNAFVMQNPEIDVEFSILASNAFKTSQEGIGNLSFVSNQYLESLNDPTVWKMVVGKDILVPIMNANNPFLEEIMKQGLSPDDFANAFVGDNKMSWATLLNTKTQALINSYHIINSNDEKFLAEFLNTDKLSIKAKASLNVNDLINSVQKDKYAIGFCKLIDVQNEMGQGLIEGIRLIPIDINANNKMDSFERIYADTKSLERGVWLGKYPKSLYGRIYAISTRENLSENDLSYLKWVLTEGQNHLSEVGYSKLIANESQAQVQRLFVNQMPEIHFQRTINSGSIMFLIFIAIALVLIVLNTLRFFAPDKRLATIADENTSGAFPDTVIDAPSGYLYDKTHTWAFMEKDGNIRIGIDDFLMHTTGEITRVKMRSSGEELRKGEPFISIVQYGKQLDILSPISGTIISANADLNQNSSLLNSSPYTEGWIYIIETPNWIKEVTSFLMIDSYKAWIKNEIYRLKHFFSSTEQIKVEGQLQFIIQDGGEINDKPLENYGPIIWEEFQRNFINQKK